MNNYIVLATESDETESWVVQRTFTSETELTYEQLQEKFLASHCKEAAEDATEPTDDWTEDDFQDFYEENGGNIHVDHMFKSPTPIHLEEVAK